MASFISFPFALRKSDRMHQAARGNDAISPDLQGEGRWKYRCCCCCCCVVVWGMICGFDPSELIFLFFFFFGYIIKLDDERIPYLPRRIIMGIGAC